MLNMLLNNVTKQFLAVLFPLVTVLASIFLLFQEDYFLVLGIVLLGMTVDMIVDYKIKGLDMNDERYYLIINKGSDFAHRMTYSVIMVLLFIHYMYKPLEAGFVLVLLLVVGYASATLSALYMSYKH